MLKFQRIQVNETGLRVIFIYFLYFACLHDFSILKVALKVDLQITNALQKSIYTIYTVTK